MSAPSASTVTQSRSSAAKAVLDRGRASLRLRPASSSSSSRFTTPCAPCRATTTARASAVRTSSLISQGLRVCQTKSGIIYISLTATIAFDACDSPPFSLWSAHSAPPRTASPQTATRTRCQRRASSALVAETAVRTFGGIGVLGRVPSGSREGRVPSACITFFRSCH